MTRRRDRDLAAYYDAEAAAGVRSELSERRLALHRQSSELFGASGVRTIADVGAGTGLDLERFRSHGFEVAGVDLSVGNVGVMSSRGLPAAVGSSLALPLPTDAFDVVWTMSTLVHISDADVDVAISELCRVCRPGGALAIGSWGGRDREGAHEFTRFEPARFFSLRAHDRWCRLLERIGTVERFDTFATPEVGWEYQFAIVRP